jgi:hypothetical protein
MRRRLQLIRLCAFCRVELEDPRPNKRFCDSSCRRHYCRAWEENARYRCGEAGKACKTVRMRPKRASKRGHGTRLYVVPDEIAEVLRDLAPRSPKSERFVEKLRSARKRAERRAAA